MKFNIEFILGLVYIAFVSGAATTYVGEMTKGPSIVEWYFPLQILLIVVTPFLCGYFGGLRK